jgi:hypothetical protein
MLPTELQIPNCTVLGIFKRAYSKERTTKKSMQAEKVYKLPRIYMEKTAVKLDQTGR